MKKIFLHQLSELETELDLTEGEPWVKEAVLRVDEVSDTQAPSQASRPIEVHFNLRKVDEVAVVDGRIDTYIELVCSRCANLFQHPCKIRFSALFCKDPIMAGVAHLQKQGDERDSPTKPVGQNQGFARHAHDPDSDDAVMEGKDLDITYLSNDYIDLSDVLTEQLQLQVPFQPLCRAECNGICSQCGTDLNLGRCACEKIVKTRPFSVLSDFKI